MGMLLVPVFDTLALVIDIYFKIVVVEIVLHYLLHFKMITVSNKYAEKFMEILKKLTEPVYQKIRSKVPAYAGFDTAPFVLLLALFFVARLIYACKEMMM